MAGGKKSHKARLYFIVSLIVVVLLFAFSFFRVSKYNSTLHYESFSGARLFSEDYGTGTECSVKAIPRGSTWTKAFDLNNEGITEHNYRAYTFDFPIRNNTADEISDLTFVLHFDKEVFLLSAWNGELEIHQGARNNEYVATVPDLREFHAENFSFDTVTFDGETLIRMKPGDYLKYIPSSNENAMEIPLEPYEGTVPGIILYAHVDDVIDGWVLELEYHYNRLLTRDVFFWVSAVGMFLWIISHVVYIITSAQIKKYKLRHERDNEIIHESIETFTGFIDAKDPYTNGHSNRVAEYTRAIAEEMGYSGEELDRIYCIALLHDCGKIGVPDSILKKPDRLTDEEFEIIKSHTVRGGEILRNFKSLKDVEEGALYHHERFDGRGYPEGRAGEDIPLVARIICVADSFDAMNSNRVYRRKLTPEMIVEEIEKNKGKQFDPDIADIFLGLLKEGKIK
ncbi:MAG: HD-GYP domain-containing protein [Lachnospiraceae bacterium]|nr:HD-GYP domain-containing protein [Lachnospiraceae bacterium]